MHTPPRARALYIFSVPHDTLAASVTVHNFRHHHAGSMCDVRMGSQDENRCVVIEQWTDESEWEKKIEAIKTKRRMVIIGALY